MFQTVADRKIKKEATMKKRYFIIALLCLMLVFSLAFAACGNPDNPSDPDDPNHRHSFKTEWAFDDTQHWHESNCGHEVESERGDHQFDSTGRCTMCNQQIFKVEGSFNVYALKGTVNEEKVMPEASASDLGTGNIIIHYRRIDSSSYKKWGFWLWASGADGVRYALQFQDDFGGITVQSIEPFGSASAKIGIIPINDDITSGGSWYTKDSAGADRYFVPAEYEGADGNYHIYLVEGDGKVYKSAQATGFDKLNFGITAKFTTKSLIDIVFATPVTAISVYENETLLGAYSGEAGHVGYTLDKDATLGNQYIIKATFKLNNTEAETSADIRIFYDDPEFAKVYYYGGDDLGATLDGDYTTFKVWSPVSNRMVLNLYNEGDGGEAYETHEMVRQEHGIWAWKVHENLAGKYYTYTVYNSAHSGGMEIVDPYAKSAGVSGLRGMIVNFDSDEAKPEGWDDVRPTNYDANELVVWETHVQDVTASRTWRGSDENRYKFLGVVEPNTKYTQGGVTVTTGFDHIKELGVNAVQLLPVFDQANDEEAATFNWGYNPLNYNVLEGGYSSDASDGYARIKEFRQLVMAFSKENINVIMDVVYNHVNDAGTSNFEALMPGYYFRYNANGTLNNDSGCGNVVKSERPMMHKFIVDSVCFWAETYKLGGFRFDIMGLEDIDTMKDVFTKLREIFPGMMVYGEAWNNNSSSTTCADQKHASLFPEGMSQFNDNGRDSFMGFSVGASTDDQQNRLKDALKGFTTWYKINDMYKTLNYVTCHDDCTLKDFFTVSPEKKQFITPTGQANTKKAAMLANSLVLTSNGITLIYSGEEFLRSKYDLGAKDEQIRNSYNAGFIINSLDYSLKITNSDMFENYKKLIEFKRKYVDDFGLDSNEDVASNFQVNISGGVVFIDITGTNGEHWVVAHSGPNGSGSVQGTVWLSTTNNNTQTLQPFETKIVKVA